MQARDYIEPLPVHRPNEPLRTAMRSLRAGIPVAVGDDGQNGWRLVRPVDALAFPLNRQLCDLPSHSLPTVSVDGDIELARLVEHDVWGTTRQDVLVGRIDSLRVVSLVAAMTDDDAERGLAAAARERLMPKLLHDLSNALTVASALEHGAPHAPARRRGAAESIRHAGALVMHMRALYADSRSATEQSLDLGSLLGSIEPMLRVAAAPAALSLDCGGSVGFRGQRWRLESVLLNLVLNASELATRVHIRATGAAVDHLELTVEDDGPGFECVTAPSPSSSPLRGHGISSIRRQVALMGGRTRLERSPSGGGLVRIRLPCGL